MSKAYVQPMSEQDRWGAIGDYLKHWNLLPLPQNMLILDIETTSVTLSTAWILQIGYAQVLNGKLVSHGAAYLETPDPVLDAYDKSDYVLKQIAAGNNGYVKSDEVRKFGLPRDQIFELIQEIYNAIMAIPDGVLGGHNTVGFDIPIIEYNFQREGRNVKFIKDRVIDTGALFKAHQGKYIPDVYKSPWEFFHHVRDIHMKGVFWNLTKAANMTRADDNDELRKELVQLSLMRGITEVDGVPVQEAPLVSLAHDAEADCLLTLHVIRSMPQLLSGQFDIEVPEDV